LGFFAARQLGALLRALLRDEGTAAMKVLLLGCWEVGILDSKMDFSLNSMDSPKEMKTWLMKIDMQISKRAQALLFLLVSS